MLVGPRLWSLTARRTPPTRAPPPLLELLARTSALLSLQRGSKLRRAAIGHRNRRAEFRTWRDRFVRCLGGQAPSSGAAVRAPARVPPRGVRAGLQRHRDEQRCDSDGCASSIAAMTSGCGGRRRRPRRPCCLRRRA